jgi:TatD DNase family protein
MWFDAHNHLQDPRFGIPAADLIAAMRGAGIGGCIATGTREADWPLVAALARAHPDFVRPAFGIHPWHAAAAAPGWDTRLAAWLERFPTAVVGEIGLDRWVNEPAPGLQLPLFRRQWQIAADFGRPLAVHCLKAWPDLFRALDKLPALPGHALAHGFGGPPEAAADLLARGWLLGFGGYCLHPRHAARRELFAGLPADCLLVETDAPDMAGPAAERPFQLPDPTLNHPANLDRNARALAGLRGEAPAALAATLAANTARWLDPR